MFERSFTYTPVKVNADNTNRLDASMINFSFFWLTVTAAAARGQSLVKSSDSNSVEQVYCTPSFSPWFDCDLDSRSIRRVLTMRGLAGGLTMRGLAGGLTDINGCYWLLSFISSAIFPAILRKAARSSLPLPSNGKWSTGWKFLALGIHKLEILRSRS